MQTSDNQSNEPCDANLRGFIVIVLTAVASVVTFCVVIWMARDSLRLPSSDRAGFDLRVALKLRGRGRPGAALVGVVLGDSKPICGRSPRVTLAQALETQAPRGIRGVHWLNLASPAMPPLVFYEILEDVLATGPDVIVVELNPAYLWPSPPPPPRGFDDLARKLSLRRAIRIRHVLDAHGQSVLDPWIYQVEEWLGLVDVVAGIRERWLTTMAVASDRLLAVIGVEAAPDVPRSPRGFTDRGAATVPLVEHWLAATLRALSDELSGRGVPWLVYVSPMTSADRRQWSGRLGATIEATRVAVGAPADQWLDLHDAAPDRLFRDETGHLERRGCSFIARRIAVALPIRKRQGTRGAGANRHGIADHLNDATVAKLIQ